MKTIIKSLAAFLMCAFLFTSCSSDDDPKTTSLDEVVTHIESVVNSHLGELYGNETLDHLMLPVDSDAKAKEVVKAFIGKDWDGQDYTYQVPGTDLTRRVIRVEKIAPTAEKYPRRFARIQKAPL